MKKTHDDLPALLRERLRMAKGLEEDCDLTGWGPTELRGLGRALFVRLVRGAIVRSRLGTARGYVLAERRVRLSHPRGIVAGRGFSLEEGCEIVGLSRQGVRFGDRCTVGRFAVIRPTNVLFGPVGEGTGRGESKPCHGCGRSRRRLCDDARTGALVSGG